MKLKSKVGIIFFISSLIFIAIIPISFVSAYPRINYGPTYLLGKDIQIYYSDVAVSIPLQGNQSVFDPNNVNITMSRGPCHGICPVYYLEIHGDGKVIYIGYEHVNVTGERTLHITPEKVKELVNEFYNSGYFNLKDRYDQIQITDQPTVETSIKIDGTFKSVYDYLGTFELPELKNLRNLEIKIDEVTNSSQWIKP